MQPSQKICCELRKGSYKGVEPAAKSGEPVNVVHMSSTIAPSLTTAIMFRHMNVDVIEKRTFLCQWTKKMVKVLITNKSKEGILKP